MRLHRILFVLALLVSTIALSVDPPAAHASMQGDVNNKIVRWITQQDAIARCNSVYGTRFKSAVPVIPQVVKMSSLKVSSHLCGGYAPLLAKDVNDAYCKAGKSAAAVLDPIFKPKWWIFGREFVGWACVKL